MVTGKNSLSSEHGGVARLPKPRTPPLACGIAVARPGTAARSAQNPASSISAQVMSRVRTTASQAPMRGSS